MRVGIGVDFHELVAGRRLVLGGVDVPFETGLLGHSDADVLSHAICDALLGAAGLGDIGQHFPDTDARYKDISSLVLLERTRALLERRALAIVNVDATVIAQAPKLSGYFTAMKANLARSLNVDPAQLNVKATTPEGLGFIGSGEGMAAWASASLKTP